MFTFDNFFYVYIIGTSALHIAVKKRSLELVQVLLEYGADPLQPDKVS